MEQDEFGSKVADFVSRLQTRPRVRRPWLWVALVVAVLVLPKCFVIVGAGERAAGDDAQLRTSRSKSRRRMMEGASESSSAATCVSGTPCPVPGRPRMTGT